MLSDTTTVINLIDYLQPGAKRPYSTLAPDLEHALTFGKMVMLVSVPGFCMMTGHPNSERPWLVNGRFYKTAKRALRA